MASVRDLRYAVRFLWQHKAFAGAAVLTLAIGLGANTAFFGLLSAVLRPMAVPDAAQIVAIAAETRNDETGGFQFFFSVEQMKDLQERAGPFSDVMGFMVRIGGMSVDADVAPFWFNAVSNNFFTGLGVTPALGTFFTDRSGSPVHVVLGHSFWQKTFGGDPGVIGRSVRIDGEPAVVIGVVEPSFHGPLVGVEIDGYIALDDLGAIAPDVNRWLYHDRRARAVQLLARMEPGMTVREAQAAMEILMSQLESEHPATDRGIGARVIPEPRARPLPMRAVSDVIPFVQVFGFGLAALVLLLACMNVANLLLVRASARQREMAVRAALGASRARLVRQMVTEGLLLSTLGGCAGCVVGLWVSAGYLQRLDLGADMPLRLDVTFDWSVFAFSLGVTILAGVAIGLWPAWRASRADARAALHDGGRSQSDGVDRQRLRRLLVVGQISGALSLLIVAGLFVRTLSSAEHIDLGFDADRLITVRLDPRQIGYGEDRTIEFYKELERRVTRWPEAESVALAFTTPMSHLIAGGSVFIEAQPLEPNAQPPVTFLNYAGHRYFPTMGIPIVRGRAFAEDDERDTTTTNQVVIVNETMAAKYWPRQDPIGKRLRVFSATNRPLEVVGVARDSKYVMVFESPRPYLYLPLGRDQSLRTLHVRAAGDPAALASRLEREIRDLAPELPLSDLRTMNQSLSGMFGYLLFRVGAIQAGGMGLIGLVLAIVGVYGVVSFGAAARTREIGIRVSLGASTRDVLRLILGDGLRQVVIGIALGLALSIAMGRIVAGFVPLVDANDWTTFAGVASGLAALALLACYVPARRATKVPVMTALRHE
jgi:predicted permease